MVRSQSSTPDSNLRGRLTWFQESHGQLTERTEKRTFGGFSVFSAVIGVFSGLMSASVRMHRKRASRSRFVEDVASWLRRWAVSQSGHGSREGPGPSVPGRVRCAPSRQMLFWSFQVRTRMTCCLPEGRVARTSGKCLYNFWIPQNGDWRRLVVSFARRTSEFSKHVPSCMLSDMQRREKSSVGHFLILPDNLALVLALCTLLSVTRRIFASGFSNHTYRPMFPLIAWDIQRLSHLKGFPPLGRMIASAA